MYASKLIKSPNLGAFFMSCRFLLSMLSVRGTEAENSHNQDLSIIHNSTKALNTQECGYYSTFSIVSIVGTHLILACNELKIKALLLQLKPWSPLA